MRKLVAISIMAALLLSVAVAAMATETNWTLYVKAADNQAAYASLAGQYGTYNGALDAKDARDSGLSINDTNFNVGSLHIGDTANGWVDVPAIYSNDKRAPITGTQTEVWNIGIFAGLACDATNLHLTWYNLSGLDMPTSFKGVNYVYTLAVTQDPTGLHSGWTQTFDAAALNGTSTAPNGFLDWSSVSAIKVGANTEAQIASKSIILTLTAAPAGQPPITPEPSSMVALASGLFGLVGFSIRRRK